MFRKKKTLKKGDIAALEQDTKFGRDELRALEKAFNSYDKKKKGYLDETTFGQLLIDQKLFPGISPESIHQLFIAFDADGSGTIEFREVATSFSVVMRGTLSEKLEYMFDVYDKDGSGQLDKEEVSSIIEQMKAVAVGLGRDPSKIGPFAEGILKKLDADGSGQIDRTEWMEIGLETPSLNDLLTGGQYHESQLSKTLSSKAKK